jgi:hypothetical protein
MVHSKTTFFTELNFTQLLVCLHIIIVIDYDKKWIGEIKYYVKM